MAKGARNSVRKINNRALKAKVFGPVENARAERLNAKLMELVAQPKPAREEMEVEATSGKTVLSCIARHVIHHWCACLLNLSTEADANKADSASKGTSDANGMFASQFPVSTRILYTGS